MPETLIERLARERDEARAEVERLRERVDLLEHVVGLAWAAGYEDESEKWTLGVVYEALEKVPEVDALADRASAETAKDRPDA